MKTRLELIRNYHLAQFWILMALLAYASFSLTGCGYFAPAVVTKAEFDALNPGDSLATVQGKIGEKGAMVSQSGEFQVWQWQNGSGSNALITFGPNGMESKAQAGL